MSQLDRTHLRAQQQLRTVVGATVQGMLGTITLERSQLIRDAYTQAAARTVAAGQRQAGRFALAYIAALSPPRHPPDLDRALEDLLVTPDSGLVVGPLLRLWSLLDDGADEVNARQDAGVYGAGLAETSLQGAARAGIDEGVDAAERRARHRLEPAAGACEWCQFIASTGARYLTAESVPVPHSPTNPRHKGGVCNCTPATEFD